MNTRYKEVLVIWVFSVALFVIGCQTKQDGSEPKDHPNILWLTVEDINPYAFGCYGSEIVKTPNIDQLAAGGISNTNASATSPYCSLARSTIISGQYSSTFGNDWRREVRLVPEDSYFFTKKLREACYFCTNNAKTDYNVDKHQWNQIKDEVWDEVGGEASYNSEKRKESQPFLRCLTI